MSHILTPPTVPPFESKIEGISIEIEPFQTNLSPAGRGDHTLEDWFWQITVTNSSHLFCPLKGSWGFYVVRSIQPINLTFNTTDQAVVIQFWPDDSPMKFVVAEDSDGQDFAICLINHFHRPGVGDIEHVRGLYTYPST